MNENPDLPSAPRFVLAVETSIMTSSVALLDNSVLVAEQTVRTARGHASKLLPMVDNMMEAAGLALSDVDLMAVPLGPGSFTGIRIGLSTMKGLAWSSKTPLVGVCSLETLALGTGIRDQPVVAVLDARKGEVFLAIYKHSMDGSLEVLLEPIVAPPERALSKAGEVLGDTPGVFVGEGVRVYPEVFSKCVVLERHFDLVRAAVMGARARRVFEEKGASSASELQPIYLRRSDAEIQVGAPTGTRETVILT